MPTCRICKDDADELMTVKIEGKRRKVCEDCAERLEEEAMIAQESESVIQDMMGFKGRR
jgi:ribosome-binding protein aMBF1 (putative translation factor)